jgi:hypothetical protein
MTEGLIVYPSVKVADGTMVWCEIDKDVEDHEAIVEDLRTARFWIEPTYNEDETEMWGICFNVHIVGDLISCMIDVMPAAIDIEDLIEDHNETEKAALHIAKRLRELAVRFDELARLRG